MREAFGPQVVSIHGVPKTNHMARVLFAAVYKMKRLGMKPNRTPVKGLPSYIDMIRNSLLRCHNHDGWMSCDYNAIEHSEDFWHGRSPASESRP